MGLFKEDEIYLNERGYNYTLSEDSTGLYLVLKDYELSPVYNQSKAEVLIKIPIGYPMLQLDMFFVKPDIRVKETNLYPPQAECKVNYIGDTWQQFSRHYEWKQTYRLDTHIKIVDDILASGRWQ